MAKKNKGKVFEDAFKSSLPAHCLLIRIPDPPHSWDHGNATRFAVKNPCDFIMFDSHARVQYCLELKTTKSKSMSYDDVSLPKSEGKMVKKHQIEALTDFGMFDYVRAGFLFNFRDETSCVETTYFQDIRSFNEMRGKICKKSFNEKDLMEYNAVVVNGKKKRTLYSWDIDGLLSELDAKYEKWLNEEATDVYEV